MRASSALRGVAVAATGVALALSGCSSSPSTSTGGGASSSAATSGGSGAASSSPTAATSERELRAIAYVPPASAPPAGFTATPATSSDRASDAAGDAALDACIGANLFREVANQAASDDFTNAATSTFFASHAQVLPAGDVTRDMTALTDPAVEGRIPGCLQRYFNNTAASSTGGSGASVDSVVRISIPGARYAARMKISADTVTYLDFVFFGRGRVEEILTVGKLLTPPDAALDASLVTQINTLLAMQ